MHNPYKYIFAHYFNIVICVIIGWSIVIYHDYNLKTIIFEAFVILE
jgi:hypothetical protein